MTRIFISQYFSPTQILKVYFKMEIDLAKIALPIAQNEKRVK